MLARERDKEKEKRNNPEHWCKDCRKRQYHSVPFISILLNQRPSARRKSYVSPPAMILSHRGCMQEDNSKRSATHWLTDTWDKRYKHWEKKEINRSTTQCMLLHTSYSVAGS